MGLIRSLHFAVKFDGNTSALEEWNKKLLESGKYGDTAAGSINTMEREMVEYAQKIGLTKSQLNALAKVQLRDNQINDFAKQYGMAAGEVKRLSAEAEKASGKLGKVADGMKAFAAAAAATAIITVGGGFVKQAAQYEQTSIQFEVMLGSAEKAKKVMGELEAFSDVTPFKPDEVTAAGKAYLNAGVGIDKLNQMLKITGDVAAGSGANIDELSVLMARNLQNGLVQTEDINQLSDRGIPIYESLAKVMGISASNVKAYASSGKIQFAQLQAAFEQMSGPGGKYAGMMDKLATSGTGLWSTFIGKTDQLTRQFGMMILDALKPLLLLGIKFYEWLKQTPAAMSVVKIVMMVLVPLIGGALVAALIGAAAASWAFIAPWLPVAAIASIVIAVIIGIILVIEDLYTWISGGDSVIGSWLGSFKGVMTSIRSFFSSMIDWIRTTAMKFGKTVMSFLFPVAALSACWDTISGFLGRAINSLIPVLQTLGKVIIMSLFPVSVLYFFWDEISAWFSSLPDRIISFFSGLPAKLKTLLASAAPEWLQKGISVIAGSNPEVAGARADGGDVAAGKTYLVGERGPELFTPRTGGAIIPNGGGSSRSVVFAPVINISVSSGDPQKIAQAVKDALYAVFNDARMSLGVEAS